MLLLMIGAAAAASAAAPLEIKGIVAGVTTYADVMGGEIAKGLVFDCGASIPRAPYETTCRVKYLDTIGGQEVTSAIVTFADDVVSALAITVAASDAALVANAFGQKYGEPSVHPYTKQNAYGAKYQGTQYVWTRGDVSLVIETVAGNAKEGAINLISHRFIKANDPDVDDL